MDEEEGSRFDNSKEIITELRIAIGFFIVGLTFGAVGVFAETNSSVLIGLAGVGIFGGLLIVFITRSQEDHNRMLHISYSHYQESLATLATGLDLQGNPRYIPLEKGTVKMFIPESDFDTTPTKEILNSGVVQVEDGGIVQKPSGAPLYDLLDDRLAELPQNPKQIYDEMIRSFRTELNMTGRMRYEGNGDDWLTVQISGDCAGDTEKIDHPISSCLAVCIAEIYETPVHVHSTTNDDKTLTTFRWGSEYN